MSTTNIADLEAALMARAQKLADEYLDHARRARDRSLTEASDHLRVREEREILAGKALAERTYRQRIQAAEIQQHARLDRLRWDLVVHVMRELDEEIERLVADRTHYEALLQRYLARAAQAIERDELVAMLNETDRAALAPRWPAFVAAATSKRVTLADQPLKVRGGIEVRSREDDIRVDQTFEGRRERMADALQTSILARLFASAENAGNLNGG